MTRLEYDYYIATPAYAYSFDLLCEPIRSNGIFETIEQILRRFPDVVFKKKESDGTLFIFETEYGTETIRGSLDLYDKINCNEFIFGVT